MVNSWGTLATIALVVIVIFTVPPVKDKIYAATENVAKVAGLDTGKPRIGSFTAVPVDSDGDNKFEMKFEVSIAGNKKDVILEIYESKASDDLTATELKPPIPKFDADSLIYTTEGSEEMGSIEGGILTKKCPGAGGCSKIDIIKNPRSEFKPDWYRFSAVLKKNGKTVYQSDALAGIYTKDYIELLDKPVQGCDDCNVKECKRKILIGSLPPRVIPVRCADGVADVYGRAYNLLYPPILGPVTIPEPTSCQYPPENLPIVDIVDNGKIVFKFEDAFRDCQGAELSKLYAKASHWVFFSNACSYGGDIFHAMEDETVGEVNDFLDKNGEAALNVVSDKTKFALSACVGKAELAFMYMGWKASGALMPHDAVQNQLAAEIRSYVQEELPPVIRDFTTPPGSDGKFYFSWKLPTGLNNVLENKTAVNHQYGKRIGEYLLVETFEVLNNPDSGYVTSYVFDPKAHSISNVVGQHKFIITVQAAKGTEFSTNKGDAGISGIYDRDYVEMYNGEVKGCKEGNFKGAHSKFVKKLTCNVIAEKIEVLKNGAPVTEQAYDEFKSKNPSASCEFNKWDKCSDADIAGIFSIFVNKNAGVLGAPAILDCKNSLPISGTYEKVCAAKDNLIATMQLLGWGCMGDGCPRPGVMA